MKKTCAILGAGSWGTAVAIHIAREGYHVRLWDNAVDHVKALIRDKENKRYMPGVPFPKTLEAFLDLKTCTDDVDDIIIAVPSFAFRTILETLEPKGGVAWLTKGVDPKTHDFLHTLVMERFGKDYPMAAIAGPSFAKEVALEMPTTLMIASNDVTYAQRIRSYFHHHMLRTFFSDDLIGTQLSSTVKNVLAIACGISDGLGFGTNAKTALITQGFLEMRSLGLSLGGKSETFREYAGLGDLILTCIDDQSRNRRFGMLLGQGLSPQAAEDRIQQVIEGKENSKYVSALSKKQGVSMPICEQIYQIITGKIDARAAFTQMLSAS